MGLYRKGKTRIIAKFHRTDCYFSHSKEGKILSYSQINTVYKNYFGVCRVWYTNTGKG